MLGAALLWFAYDIEISKNTNFNILVIDWVAEDICTRLPHAS